MKNESRNNRRLSRAKRVRFKVCGLNDRPRVSVFKSLKSFSAQVIDDINGKTIAYVSTSKLKKNNNLNGVEDVAKVLVTKCFENNIEKIVFDRSGFKYHGKVKAFAEALRLGGLKF